VDRIKEWEMVNASNTYLKVLLIILSILFLISISGCGETDDSYTNNSSGDTGGGIAFNVVWDGAPTKMESQSVSRALDCDAAGISYVTFNVEVDIGGAANLPLGHDIFECSVGSGTVDNIKAGSNIILKVSGKNPNGITIYYGEVTEITVTAGDVTPVGEIICYRVQCTDTDSDTYYAESDCGTAVDCDDSDNNINPAAIEICNDGKDNNCDEDIDCDDFGCVVDVACPIDLNADFINSINMAFNLIPSGTFIMGSPTAELGHYSDEIEHQVILTQDFYMQTTEITQGQWKAVMGNNPSSFSSCGSDCPVEMVSWDEIETFLTALNEIDEGTYRLPTEAEWEYAARAGSTTAIANGDITQTECGNDSNLDSIGWYCNNSGSTTHPVAQKEPNEWGLFDMHGNVWEWVKDWKGDYPTDPVVDPLGSINGTNRERRGGSWGSESKYCRSGNRGSDTPDVKSGNIGFRLAYIDHSCSDDDNDNFYIENGCGTAIDCNDSVDTIYPGASEIPNDGIDQDCDGSDYTPTTFSTWYRDFDDDGYGDPTDSTGSVIQPAGYVLDNTDCDDSDINERPGQIWYEDSDEDSYGNDSVTRTDCERPTGYVLNNTDCNDSDIDEYPGRIWYDDSDEDNYGDAAVSLTQCARPSGYVLDNTDCDDSDFDVNTGASEVCNDSKDNDCDGDVDCDDTECIDYAACLPSSDYAFNYAYLQYRSYPDASHSYRGWVDFTKLGDPIVETDITQIVLKNMLGNLVSLNDIIFWNALSYYGVWNDLTSSIDFSGPYQYSGFSIGFPDGTSLASGTYTYEANTAQGDLLPYSLYFPGETPLPVVDAASMDYQWQSDDSLHLTWVAPTGDFDQIRIYILDQDWQDVLSVKLPVDANNMTIPNEWIQNIDNTHNPSSLNWEIHTRSFTTTDDDNQYARGYSNNVMVPWPLLGVSEICDNALDDDGDGDTDCNDLECDSYGGCIIPPGMALIPSGCFDMGDAFNEGATDELPVHNVCITSNFYMDVHEVTNAEYAACVSAGACTAPGSSGSNTRASYYGNPTYDDFPVIYVSWNQANEYCAWAGKRLPTEAEWEYAARGGLSGKRYPWGDIISGTDANYMNSGDSWDNDTSPMENYAANGYGLYDMAGNVWEWVNDWYQNDYYSISPTNDPPGPAPGTYRVVRSGGWCNITNDLRVAGRFTGGPSNQYNFPGFRCAGD